MAGLGRSFPLVLIFLVLIGVLSCLLHARSGKTMRRIGFGTFPRDQIDHVHFPPSGNKHGAAARSAASRTGGPAGKSSGVGHLPPAANPNNQRMSQYLAMQLNVPADQFSKFVLKVTGLPPGMSEVRPEFIVSFSVP